MPEIFKEEPSMSVKRFDGVDGRRIAEDTLTLVNIPSVTGDTRRIADRYEQMLMDAGCQVTRYELIPRNPTLVAVYGGERPGKTLLFNGHMDTIPLPHDPPLMKDGRVYGRGACDMKGSLACFLEVARFLQGCGKPLRGKVMLVANSLHESPGGRGEDLYALFEQTELRADACVVMEGATRDCPIAQFGSATFEITIIREGEPSHQLLTPPGTPHPASVAAEIIRRLDDMNIELERRYIEDIGYASYFIGSVHSGQFYNQHPNRAVLSGVRRYGPEDDYDAVQQELRSALDQIAGRYGVDIRLDFEKVRDGYRIDKHGEAVKSLVAAVRKVRGFDLPLVGKKIVTDAGIFASHSIPALCHGPDNSSAHGDVEYVEISELELTANVYVQLLEEFGLLAGEEEEAEQPWNAS
jgi:acetylornithine deacetylase/succinyl-diaminopimelate desuccinylase-like protein